MDKLDKILHVTREDDSFLIGKLDDHPYSGAFLSAEYLSRLDEVLCAARIRTDWSVASDSVKNLFGILDRLLKASREQRSTEFDSNALGEIEYAREQYQKLLDGDGDDDGPKRA